MTKLCCIACATILIAGTSIARAAEPVDNPADVNADGFVLLHAHEIHITFPALDELAFLFGAQEAKPDSPATQPATQPIRGATTQPTDPKLKSLIDQLGDDNPRTRDQATEALRKLGKDALPALRSATQNDDPQIRTSAQALISQINDKDKPIAEADAGGGSIFLNNGELILQNVHIQAGVANAQVQVQMRVANGRSMRNVTAHEDGRKILIHEDNDGLNMKITENGETKEFKAKSADELKEKEPEAYKTYEKYAAKAGGRIRIQVPPK